LAVAFIASEYGPEDAAEEPAALRAASSTQIVRDDRSRSILHSVAASSGDEDIEFVTLPPGIAGPLCQIVTPRRYLRQDEPEKAGTSSSCGKRSEQPVIVFDALNTNDSGAAGKVFKSA
jgi:hypothetical protein